MSERQKSGVTETGKEIILHDDGVWEYSEERGASLIHGDFRKTCWGMSRAQVKNLEKAELLKEGERGFVYSGKVAQYPCLIAYLFTKDELVRARYHLTTEHDYPSEYLDDFSQLHTVLEKKYGPPELAEKQWRNRLYEDDETMWGKAVALGHLVLWSVWKTERTEISLMLRGEDQSMLLEIEYSSTAHEDVEENAEEGVDLDDF